MVLLGRIVLKLGTLFKFNRRRDNNEKPIYNFNRSDDDVFIECSKTCGLKKSIQIKNSIYALSTDTELFSNEISSVLDSIVLQLGAKS